MSEEVSLDKRDKEILFELEYNARIPLTALAKKLALSPQNIKYRIDQLERKGVIKKYVTFFDISNFGFQYYRLYIRLENINSHDEKQIISYFMQHQQVVWVVSCYGKYDLEILFLARNFIHFNSMLKETYARFPNKLHNNVTSVSVSNYHQKRGYLLNKKTNVQISYGGEPKNVQLDNTDKKIIKLINQDARLSNSEIGLKLGLNYKTIQLRIRNLEKKKVIKAYRAWIDFTKIDVSYRKAMIRLKKFSDHEEKKLLEFCSHNPHITYLVTCVWPWNIEIEAEVRKENEFIDILKDFRILMGEDIIDYDTLTITAEHKLDYCPFADLL